MRKPRSKAAGRKPARADFPALIPRGECESLNDLQRAVLADAPPRLHQKLRRWFGWWNRRAHGLLMHRLCSEVRTFRSLQPRKEIKLRKMLDALAYDAEKHGLSFAFPHEWTPYLARLLMTWGVAVCIRQSDAEKLPRRWYAAQRRPAELDSSPANVATSENHFAPLPGFDHMTRPRP